MEEIPGQGNSWSLHTFLIPSRRAQLLPGPGDALLTWRTTFNFTTGPKYKSANDYDKASTTNYKPRFANNKCYHYYDDHEIDGKANKRLKERPPDDLGRYVIRKFRLWPETH
jgi:hypothetical protein